MTGAQNKLISHGMTLIPVNKVNKNPKTIIAGF